MELRQSGNKIQHLCSLKKQSNLPPAGVFCFQKYAALNCLQFNRFSSNTWFEMLHDIHKHNGSYFKQNHSKKCSESNPAIHQSRQPCPAPMCGGRGAAIRGAGGASQGPAHGEAPPVQAPPSPAPNVGKCEHTNQPNSWWFVEKMARAGVDIFWRFCVGNYQCFDYRKYRPQL